MSEWHEEYKRRYKLAKENGKSFFPHAVFKDAVVSFAILCALSYLAIKHGAVLEDLANPTDATYNPRPEWYFLFLFQALKAFPGRLEPVAAVVLPGLGVGLLLLLPFLDRGPERHPLRRPFWTALGLGGLGGVALLTYAGYTSPMLNPIVESDPLASRGQRLYQSLNCAYCHQISGKGGDVGPALDAAGSDHPEDWLKKHFRAPRSVSPGSVMPKLNLLDEEIDELTAYVKSLGAGAPFTAEAPKLFAENCAACHKIGKNGGEAAPDLSFIGSARDKAYIKRYIVDPGQVNPQSAMPGFKGQMTDVQIDDLARYLSSLR
ncbi:MAG: c-type cytochrome [Elusimicrobia bacterium]|nr:c-type cytochrome [Elusimicrobiota bacterium]